MLEVNIPEVVTELVRAFETYERALRNRVDGARRIEQRAAAHIDGADPRHLHRFCAGRGGDDIDDYVAPICGMQCAGVLNTRPIGDAPSAIGCINSASAG